MNNYAVRIALAALFTSLIVVGALFSIPLPAAPLVLTIFFLQVAALIQGPWWGLASGVTYLAMGALGLGVFAKGQSGIVHFSGPLGGFLLGYLALLLFTGLFADRRNWNPLRNTLAAAFGLVGLYALGLPWLQMANQVSAPKQFGDLWLAFLTMSPFLISDLVKSAAAVILVTILSPLLKTYFPKEKL